MGNEANRTPFLEYKLRGRDESRWKSRCLDNATIFSHSVHHPAILYFYYTPSLRRRQSQSTKENPLTGFSDLSSTENALPVVTNTPACKGFSKSSSSSTKGQTFLQYNQPVIHFHPIFFVRHYGCHFEGVSWQSRWGFWSLSGKKQRDCGGVRLYSLTLTLTSIAIMSGILFVKMLCCDVHSCHPQSTIF